MNVDFTPEQQPFVQQAIERGRIHRPEDAAQEAFSLWVERERALLPQGNLGCFGNRPFNKSQAQAAASRLLERREHYPLPEGITIRDLVHASRD